MASTIVFYTIAFLLAIVLWRLLRFATTPLLKRAGVYRYYSPMFFITPAFLLEKLSYNVYEFHVGTAFDFFRMQKVKPVRLILFILEGMIKLIADIEAGKVSSNISFKGTTFYIGLPTAKRFGFRHRNLNLYEKFMFVLNYLELCVLYSISHGRPALVPLNGLKIISITAGELIQYKDRYIELYNTLITRITKDYKPDPEGVRFVDLDRVA